MVHQVEQLHKIFKLCGSPSEEYWKKSNLPHATIFKPQHPYKRCFAETFKYFPPTALSLLDALLAFEPECRGSTSSALQSKFFTTRPLPCDPLSLPKYPPSKEFDIKVRDEEARSFSTSAFCWNFHLVDEAFCLSAQGTSSNLNIFLAKQVVYCYFYFSPFVCVSLDYRQKAAAVKRRGLESRKGNRESNAMPAPDANAELHVSIQKRQGQSSPKSISEKYNPEEDSGSGFSIDPSSGPLQNGFRHGRVIQPGTSLNMNVNSMIGSSRHNTEFRTQRSYRPQGAAAAQLSQFSSSVAVRGSSRLDLSRDNSACSNWSEEHSNVRYNQLNVAESSHYLLDRPNYSYNKDEEIPRKESTVGYAPKKSRIHYSGPLVPAGGNIEEMLKEHEKQIQHAVRKARSGMTRNKKGYNENGQMESLLLYGGYAR